MEKTGCVKGNCFYPNFAVVVHRETCSCLLQLIVPSLPLFSFLQPLRPVFLPVLVPLVHNPSVILCAVSSQFSLSFLTWAVTQLPSSSLPVLSLHYLASILSLSFSFPSPVSPGSSFSAWLINACVVGGESLLNSNSITVLLCHSNPQILEGATLGQFCSGCKAHSRQNY